MFGEQGNREALAKWLSDVFDLVEGGGDGAHEIQAGGFVGVFGEADEHALDCEVRAGCKPLATFRGNHGAGPGRLFIWRQALVPGWERGEAGERDFAFDPLPSPDGSGEFRVGAVCTATILPAGAEPASAANKNTADARTYLRYSAGG